MMTFDAVVGNPPYNVMDGGAQASATPLYNEFVSIAKKISPDYLTMIMPSRWYAGGKGLDEFRSEMLDDTHISELHDFLHPEDVFPDTNNRGGICYFVRVKNYDNTTDKVKVVTHESKDKVRTYRRSLRTRDLDIFVRDGEALAIFDKVMPNTEIPSISKYISSRKPFGLDGNFIKTAHFHRTSDTLSNPIKCYGKAKAIGYVDLALVKSHKEWIDKWKVFMPYANNIGTELNDDNQNAFVGAPNTVCTETFLVVGAELNLSETAAQNLCKYLKTKFARYLLRMAKISQHATAKTYRFVPMQDFTAQSNIDWSKPIPAIDAQLYKKYTLTPDEISFIESMIKPME